VDAELSLLAQPNYPINAFVPNPLFQNDRPTRFDQSAVVKVGRLDGPTVEDAMSLVDRALVAERTGLLGRAYVDLSAVDPLGNLWFEATANEISSLGFDVSIDRAPATMPATARIDAPVLYFGWWSDSLDGPFKLPGFRFPPGAIALHLYSYSAATLHSTTNGWTGPLIARGVTATVGNVFEPYLGFTHRPNLFFHALARGATLADAAYYSLQGLSWQAVLIGDPLYRPFLVPLDEQLRHLTSLPPEFAPYAVLRRMRLLDAAGEHERATDFARRQQREHPSLALGLALAQRLHAAGALKEAADTLTFATSIKSFSANEWALAREAALLLNTCGHPAHAVEIWRALLDEPALPEILRLAWIIDARDAAIAAKSTIEIERWTKEAVESERATKAGQALR
jgi:hypothetical protein